MHVTACLAGQKEVDVEVGGDCRTLPALKEAIVNALPKLCVEGFAVSVGGRALDDDEGVVSLEERFMDSSHGGYPWGWDSGTVTSRVADLVSIL